MNTADDLDTLQHSSTKQLHNNIANTQPFILRHKQDLKNQYPYLSFHLSLRFLRNSLSLALSCGS